MSSKTRKRRRQRRATSPEPRQVPERVLEAVLSEPWAIQPEWLNTIIAIASREQSDLEAVARKQGEKMEDTRRVTVRDGVATIAVRGPIFRYANLFTMISGATTVSALATDFQSALEDDRVDAILLDIDSPGGQVNGIAEMAKMIFDARGDKPIIAYAGGTCASAAYWLAAAAEEIIVGETALVGSIGVMGTFVEHEVEGERSITIVSSQSPDKNPDPFSKQGRERIQTTVDALAEIFITAVAKYRGVSPVVVMRDFGRGDILVGVRAVEAGMGDQVGTYEGVHESLTSGPDDEINRLPSFRMAAERLVDYENVAAELLPVLSSRVTPIEVTGGPWTATHLPFDLIRAVHDDDPETEDEVVDLDPDKPTAVPAETKESSTMKDTETAAAAVADRETAVKAERERCQSISRWGAHFKCETVAQDCVNEGLTVEASLEKMRHFVETENKGKAIDITPGDADNRPIVGNIKDRELEKPWGATPEAALGNQLLAVREHGIGASQDPRLFHVPDAYKAATGIGEAVDSEGGFLVAPDQSSRFLENMWSQGEVMSRVTRTTVQGNGLTIPGVDESSRADGSRYGGVRGYWVDEAEAATATKPKYRKIELKTKKVAAAVYVTDEELEDAPALGQRLSRAVPDELTFKIEDAIINGDGAGKPLGMLSAAVEVEVAIQGSQTIANTNQSIVANIAKMISRLPGRSLARAVLLFNNQMFYQFATANIGGSGAPPVFLPGGTAQGAPFGSFLGIPMVPVEYCQAEGTVGDLILTDLSQYELIDKGGIRSAQSIHVKFLEEEQVFRFSMRVDGQPSWRTSITPFKGTGNISPVVTLGARS